MRKLVFLPLVIITAFVVSCNQKKDSKQGNDTPTKIANIGDWRVKTYYDKNDSITDYKYIVMAADGVFLEKDGRECPATCHMRVDVDNVRFRLWHMHSGRSLLDDLDVWFYLNLNFSNGDYSLFPIKKKDSGHITYVKLRPEEHERTNDSNNMSFIEALRKEGVVTMIFSNGTKYSNDSLPCYRFSINLTGFNEAIKYCNHKLTDEVELYGSDAL